uniref:PHD-type domain-containing protein n=1 Tax=Anopheles coluzzii TaxID=1518534 RepID=A0A8W7Q0V0_ANOCL
MESGVRQKSAPPRKTCYACNIPGDTDMIECNGCNRYVHLTCLTGSESSSSRKWLCAFCTLNKMKEQCTIPLDQVMNRLESIERKMETTAKAPPPMHGYASCSTTYGLSMEGAGDITRSQASARQAGAGKLPTFSGNPEEWGMFISTFEETMQLCGFTDRENVNRLQHAL